MNIDELNEKWHGIQEKIRQQWPALTDDNMKQLETGEMLLSDLLQKRYGITAGEARTAVDKFIQQFNI